jgi:hypothetical protein
MGRGLERKYPLGKASGVVEIEGVLSSEFCSSLVLSLTEDFDNLFFQGGTLGGLNTQVKLCHDSEFLNPNYYNAEKTNNLFQYSHAEHEILTRMHESLSAYIQDYPQLWNMPSSFFTGIRIQRYKKNQGYYREHSDGMPWDFFYPQPNNRMRVLAFVMYLNTVEHGGGTRFPMHDYTSDAVEGKFLMFPTSWTYPHMGLVPHSSDKWIISSFVYTSPVEDFETNNTLDSPLYSQEQ